ncbi:DUF2955 domain-containing protein [Motilimonas eburnea]|uniref:DUF2955 domain-containing protein n=1 Tax=Motilimonas eburnea TaxID=1737488 RepID=UPI001E5B1785|nr:DUF2955 domain-containing protein [Motilimonas eburnea]MCE2570003.1 DUF2955 domain-containing protein [Motilimonas eburnea]
MSDKSQGAELEIVKPEESFTPVYSPGEILQRRVLRFTLGITLAVAISALVNWTLAYIMPILLAKFLVDRQAPRVQTVYELVISMLLTIVIAWFVSVGLLEYPSLLLPLIAVLLLVSYYLFTDPRWNFFATMLLVSSLVIPYTAIISPGIGMVVGVGLCFSGLVSVLLFSLLHIYLPDLAGEKEQLAESELDKATRLFESVKALIIAFPVIVFIYTFELSGAMLTMIFVAILSLQTAGQKSVKLTLFMLLTNIIGGIIAIVVYNLVSFVPVIGFYLCLIFVISLQFAHKMYANPDKAMVFSTIFSTLLVLVSSTMASGSGDVDSNFYARIAQIGGACVYLVVISFFIEGKKWNRLRSLFIDQASTKEPIKYETK